MLSGAFRTLRPLPLVLVLITTALATAPTPAPRVLYTGTDDKPADVGHVRMLTAFDCAGRDTLTLMPHTGEIVLAGNTTGAPALLPSYTCRNWNEQGPEHIYRLEVEADLQLWAGLSNLGANDLDLFLLDGCDTDRCLAGANTEMTALLPAGTYWLVVDGYGTTNPAAGPYTLTLRTRWPGVPPAVCEEGGATAVECAGALIELEGDLGGAPNRIQSFSCSPSLLEGGDLWYAVTLPGSHDVTVRVTPGASAPVLDMALWLFDGCGDDALCLDYADLKSGGQNETLKWSNAGETPVTVYLAVDSRRETGGDGAGAFTIDFDCRSTVATERKSLGSVRSLFR